MADSGFHSYGMDFRLVRQSRSPNFSPSFKRPFLHCLSIPLFDYPESILISFSPKYSPTEIIAFSEATQQFASRGAHIIFASVDSEYSLLSWAGAARKEGGLGSVQFPLLSDKNHKIAKDYGVLIEDEGIALRGLFIIDPKGIIRQVWKYSFYPYNPLTANPDIIQITINDLPVGRSVDETLRLLDAFQFTEQHGEVCPANWNPGEPTIKDNPQDSKVYFNAVHGRQ